MLRLLFWNMKRLPLWDRLASLARSQTPDYVVLCECAAPPISFLAECGLKCAETIGSTRVCLLYSDKETPPKVRVNSPYSSIWELRSTSDQPLLLAGAHLPSKLYRQSADQSLASRNLKSDIEETEVHAGHRRTIVMGDLNMDAYDEGVVGCDALHAVSSKQVASRVSRTVQGRKHNLFYNPMWSAYGDMGGRSPGSYFYDGGGAVTPFWHVFDHVLVRPSLMDTLKEARFLMDDGSRSLLGRDGRPDASDCSDHLPLLAVLEV